MQSITHREMTNTRKKIFEGTWGCSQDFLGYCFWAGCVVSPHNIAKQRCGHIAGGFGGKCPQWNLGPKPPKILHHFTSVRS